MTGRDLGRVAYEAYRESCGGLSVHGEKLPDWPGQGPGIREHWRAAADAVVLFCDLAVDPDAPARRAYRAHAGVTGNEVPWEATTRDTRMAWAAAAAAAQEPPR